MRTNQAASLTLGTLRLIVGAMALSVVIFAAIVGGLIRPDPQPDPSPLLLYLPLIVFATSAPAAFALRQTMLGMIRKQGGPAQVGERATFNAYGQATIASAAMFEAPGFLGVIMYMLTGSFIALAVIPLSLGALALIFPMPMAYDRFREAAEGR